MNTEDRIVEVGGGAWIVWRANEPALADVSFVNDVWEGKMMLVKNTNYNLNDIVLQLGYLDGNVFKPMGETKLADEKVKDWGAFYEIGTIFASDSFTVPKDDYLALKVVNNSAETIKVRTGSSHSWFKSPVTDPTYPVPEIPALPSSLLPLV